jgi:hypothetical protein
MYAFLYLLYCAKVALGLYALTMLCTETPYGLTDGVLVWTNAVFIPVYLFVYGMQGTTGFADLAFCLFHSSVVLALATNATLDYAMIAQLVGTFTDIHRAVYYISSK